MPLILRGDVQQLRKKLQGLVEIAREVVTTIVNQFLCFLELLPSTIVIV